jgi:CHAT domain-containing protein
MPRSDRPSGNSPRPDEEPTARPFRANSRNTYAGQLGRGWVIPYPFLLVFAVLGVVAGLLIVTRRDADLLLALTRGSPDRTFAARLSIHQRYQPCEVRPATADSTIPRVDCPLPGESPLSQNDLAQAATSTNPRSLRASALSLAIWWDQTPESLDDAIDRLSRAHRLSPKKVPILVDLSGAHLTRAHRIQNPKDLIAALNNAGDALSIDPHNLSALYNYALAQQWLTLDTGAARSWDRFLAVASDIEPEWAAEARRHQALLAPRVAPAPPGVKAAAAQIDAFAAGFAQEARTYGWNVVLGRWGRAWIAGRTMAADSQLLLAERLGDGLVRSGGDPTLVDAVRAIRHARSRPAALRTLAAAHVGFAHAQVNYDSADHDSALVRLQGVRDLRPESPALVAWTRVFIGGSLIFLGRDTLGAAVLDSVKAEIDSVRNPAVYARAQWMLGTVALQADAYVAASRLYQSAATIFHRLDERENWGANLYGLGESWYQSGDTVTGYRELHRALIVLREYPHSVRRHNTLVQLATSASLDGLVFAAKPIHDEDVHIATGTIRALEALQHRAAYRAMMGQEVAADSDFVALEEFRTSTPEEHKAYFDGTLRYAQALLRGGAGQDTASLSRTIDFFEKDNAILYHRGLLRRADLRLAMGDVDGAIADLDRVTARLRQTAENGEVAPLRASMIEQARSRFDQLVRLYLSKGRIVEAVQALERGRISLAPVDATRALPSGRVRAPAGAVAVEYTLHGDTLVALTIRGDTISLTRTRIARANFLLAIEQLTVAMESGAPESELRPQLTRLYDWLIRPIEHHAFRPGTQLVILADGEIAGVPFQALWDRRTRRYLVHDHVLRFAPSLADAARPAVSPHDSAQALLIANPAFDAAFNRHLDPLSGADAEVDALRRIYHGAFVLRDTFATVGALTKRAPRASVIHYAGHAVFNDARPEASYLVLAGPGEAGRLTQNDVDSMDLSRVRLVVLSACRTLRARSGRSGGFAGLSGAFLAAGAGGMVGSLWEVDDRRTQALMTDFHRAYRGGSDPAQALRDAQLAMIRRGASPAAWAGFRYVGR